MTSSIDNIETMLKKLRYLNPKGCDRTIDLMSYSNDIHIDDKTVQELQLITISRKADKLQGVLDKLEIQIMKSCGFNFAIHNIPTHASDLVTDVVTPTNYENIRATLEQFGKVDQLKIIRGTVYTRFSNSNVCNSTHSLINNMQMGENIINTLVV